MPILKSANGVLYMQRTLRILLELKLHTHTVQITNIYAYDIHGNHISLRGIKECSDALKLREAKSNFAIIEVTKEVRHCLD